MKKLFYTLSLVLVLQSFYTTAFAYNYYSDEGSYYSPEQFRRDIKSYLDDEKQKQYLQDIRDMYSGYYRTPTQTDIQNLQDKITEQQRENKIQIEALTKLQTDTADKEVSAKTISLCKEISLNQRGELGKIFTEIDQETVDICAPYGVYILTSKEAIQKKFKEDGEKNKTDILAEEKLVDKEPLARKEETALEIEARHNAGTYRIDEILNANSKASVSKNLLKDTGNVKEKTEEIPTNQATETYQKIKNKVASFFKRVTNLFHE